MPLQWPVPWGGAPLSKSDTQPRELPDHPRFPQATGWVPRPGTFARSRPGSTRATGRPLYLKAFAALQEAWLAQHPNRFSAQLWRTFHWLTPFGPIRLPTRVVRDKASGRYLTLSKVFLCPKATRLLSTALQ